MSLRFLFCLLPIASFAGAQTPGARTSASSKVSGVVRDSLAAAALSGAVVQLVASDSIGRFSRSATSDALGRFEMTEVPPGRYMLGFFHPVLDSLGLEPTVRELTVEAARAVSADLAVPSAARLRSAVCGATADSGAVVIGVVRNPRDRTPMAGVTISAEWLEVSLAREGIARRNPRVAVTTRDNGWFALCQVPSAGTVVLMAARGADSTDRFAVEIPADRLLRRELYLSSGRSAAGDVVVAGGTGRLSGTVLRGDGHGPLGGAIVSIAGGTQTRANERGEWTLADAPLGTRVLEVRALGYYPERDVIDVVVDAAPLRTTLSTMKAVMDTVRVTAAVVNPRNMREFNDRRRSGAGKYLTAMDVLKKDPIVTSDLFRYIPGLQVHQSVLGMNLVTMRSAFGGRCSPAVYVDGRNMSDLGPDEIDNLVNPDEVAGVEIYSEATVPPQFSSGLSGVSARRGALSAVNQCGSIVFWTQQPVGPRRVISWRRRAAFLGAIALSAVGLRALFH